MRALLDTIEVCDAAFRALETRVPRPVRVARGDDFVFRYAERRPEIVVVQKLSRLPSGLRACLALMERGLYQEVGVLFRTLDEFQEDISFMCESLRRNRVSELQQRFMDEFFQEEFDNENPLRATQRRDRVPRRQIRAFIARIEESPLNPSDHQELHRTIANVNSGYVHGTSAHILDSYGGSPPRYHLDGMLATRRQTTFEETAWHYFYRALLSFMEAAISLGEAGLVRNLYAFRDFYEREWGRTEWQSPEQVIRDLKRNAT